MKGVFSWPGLMLTKRGGSDFLCALVIREDRSGALQPILNPIERIDALRDKSSEYLMIIRQMFASGPERR